MPRPRNPYIVADYETSIEQGGDAVSGPCVNSDKGWHMSPYAGAHAPYLGYQEKDGEVTIRYLEGGTPRDDVLNYLRVHGDAGLCPILVGHNLGFDMHHLFAGIDEEDLPEFTIWDTQTVEYYMEGQSPESRWNSLKGEGGLTEKYGFEHKHDELGEYFKAGIGADKIPAEELEPYLHDDIAGTHHVFLAQFERARDLGMLQFLREVLDGQCAFWLMERNGMPVDTSLAPAIEAEYAGIIEETSARLHAKWEEFFPHLKPYEVDKHGKSKPGVRNPNSPTQLKTVLNGGTYKYKVTMQVGVYKNGNPKMKKVDQTGAVEGYQLNLPNTEESTLQGVADRCDVVADILEMRRLNKIVKTYCQGYLRKAGDGVLRTSYNQTVTPSARPSSSNPNLQNLPKKG